MIFVVQVFVGMVVMALLDAPMIKYVIQPTLEETAPDLIRDKMNILAALIFYVGYVSLTVFLSKQGADTTGTVARNAALLGLMSYGTYEFTNMAVTDGWSWKMVLIDTTWGVILTTIVAISAFFVGEKLS